MLSQFSRLSQVLNSSNYKLDLSGVVGLFGGDNAINALETIHLYRGRRWAGWYNYPGAVTVARRFGQMADSRFWDSLFPGPNESPAVTFKLAGKSGPEYMGSFSGTKLQTKYLGCLVAQECSDLPSKTLSLINEDGTEARRTRTSTVTVISLPPQQRDRFGVGQAPSPASASGNTTAIKHQPDRIPVAPKCDPLAFWAIAPSSVSILACVLCALSQDYLCTSLILLGIVSSGVTSIVLGTAALGICVPIPSSGSPPGDGLMCSEDGSIIVLKGEEADVNIVTKGTFELEYTSRILSHPKRHVIGLCALLLMTQCLVQLLLIPLGTLFGQIMYLVSFVASELYHLYAVSRQREKVQQELLLRELSGHMDKRELGTRTQMAVFTCLVMGEGRLEPVKSKPDAVLKVIIPNETSVWRYWRRKVLNELERFWKWNPASLPCYVPSIQSAPEGEVDEDEYAQFTEQDRKLLVDLIGDAWCVFNRYPKWRDGESEVTVVSSDNGEEKTHLLLGSSPA